ncbi:hypothetical protein C0993_005459, partial [Termitomyces sp. T159_Od127]
MRPASFFAKHVRNLFIPRKTDLSLCKALLSRCTYLKNVYFQAGRFKSASTLTSVSVRRPVLCQMANSGLIFPNLKFVGLDAADEDTRLPSCAWAPKLSILEMDMACEVQLYLEDINLAVSTAPNLTSIILNPTPILLHRVTQEAHDLASVIEIVGVDTVNIVGACAFAVDTWRSRTAEAVRLSKLVADSIRKAKEDHWVDWLENIDARQIYTAN